MADNLFEEIIQNSLSKQTSSPSTPPQPEEPPPETPAKKRLNPLLVPTVLLSVALIAALLGLISQHWNFQTRMAETVEQYEQELLVKDRWIELRTEDVENLKSVRSLYIELYFEMYSEVNGILLADVIFRLHERGVYDQAAAELINFTEQGFSLPKDQTIRSQSIAASPASAVSGLLPLYHVNYHSRLVEVARALFDMGLIEQTHLDYVTMHSVRSSVKVN